MATTINYIKKISAKNATLFTGFPGIGLVGKIVVDYMLKEIKSENIGEISSDSFPPSVITQKGILDLIKDDIYYYSQEGKDYFFIAGPIQPSLDFRLTSASDHYEFAETIIASMKEQGVTEINTLAGINVGEKRVTEKPKVVAASTHSNVLEEWKKLGAFGDRPGGLISGAAGLMLGIGKREGMQGSCLMGETNARLVYGDHGAAKALLELLLKKYPFKVDMQKMEQEAKKIQDTFKKLSQQLTETESDDAPSHMNYVR